jgi:hypothetical protein
MANYANSLSMLNGPLGPWREPEKPEGHQTPSQRRLWRQACDYDRQHHEAISAEYEATKKPGEGFVAWAQERINRQYSEAVDALILGNE